MPTSLTFKERVYFSHDIPTRWATEWEWCPCINKIINTLLFAFSSVMYLPGTSAYRRERLYMTFSFCPSHTKNSGAGSLREHWICNKPCPPCLIPLPLSRWIVKGNSKLKPFSPPCMLLSCQPSAENWAELTPLPQPEADETPACVQHSPGCSNHPLHRSIVWIFISKSSKVCKPCQGG